MFYFLLALIHELIETSDAISVSTLNVKKNAN